MDLTSNSVYNERLAEIRLVRDLEEAEKELKSGKGLTFEEFSEKIKARGFLPKAEPTT